MLRADRNFKVSIFFDCLHFSELGFFNSLQGALGKI